MKKFDNFKSNLSVLAKANNEDLEKVVVHSGKRKTPLCRQVYGFDGDLTNDDETTR